MFPYRIQSKSITVWTRFPYLPYDSPIFLKSEVHCMTYIFIHGLGQDSSSWEKTISCLDDIDESVIPLDLSIFLQDKDRTYENLYSDFSAYCHSIPGQLHLCGLSLGGILALNYALDFPEKIKSIVLIGAQYVMPKTLLKLQNIIFRLIPDSFFQKSGFEKKEFISLTNSMLHINFSSRLKDVSCNTLIICGEKDSVNKRAAKELAENIQEAKLIFVEKAGHEVNIDAPQKLAEVIRYFYRG